MESNEFGVPYNEFGVPYHEYTITLKNGEEFTIDIGCEDDWGNIQRCFKYGADGETVWCVGWGDAVEWVEIVKVIDDETGKEFIPLEWAKEDVWKWADEYAG